MSKPFRWLLASSASGSLGDGIAATAMPLLLVGLTTDPLLVASLQVAAGLPWLMLSLPVGVLVDRWDRRTILWVADTSRFVLATGLLLLIVTGAVSVLWLLGVAFLEGSATVVFRAASPAMLPSLVQTNELARANGHVQTSSMVTGGLVGPALGGFLYPLATIAPFAARSVALLVSVLCLRRLPPRPTTGPAPTAITVGKDIREGLRAVLGDRVLRSLAVTTCLLASSTGMLQAVLVLHIVKGLEAPASAYGVLFTVYALGALIGAWLVPRIRTHFGWRTCLPTAAGIGAVGLLVIGFAPTAWVAGIGMGLLGIGTMIYNVAAVTLRQERTPADLLGRVSSVFNLVGVGALPVAALLAGVIASSANTTWALVAAAATCSVSLLWLLIDLAPAGQDGV